MVGKLFIFAGLGLMGCQRVDVLGPKPLTDAEYVKVNHCTYANHVGGELPPDLVYNSASGVPDDLNGEPSFNFNVYHCLNGVKVFVDGPELVGVKSSDE